MEIKSVDETNFNEVINFLKEVSIIGNINNEVVFNGEFVFDKEIIGFLSFEEFDKTALIRYFVFQQSVTNDVISELFNRIIQKVKLRKINSLITLIVKREAKGIFKSLGFYVVTNTNVYIDEINLRNTKFKNALVLKYDIIN